VIILEGVDGGGKTTLAQKLSKALDLPMHPRASDSLTGPVKDLYGWTVADMTTWDEQPLSIYDRHPLISENIYGPYVRNDVRPGFEMGNPEIAYMRKFLRQNALVIICLPPFQVVQENVSADPEGQMPGVVDNLRHIFDCYEMMPLLWPSDSHIARYDYTVPDTGKGGYDQIYAAAKHHTYTWRNQAYVRQH